MKYYAVIQRNGDDYTVLKICHTRESLAKAMLLHKTIRDPDTIFSVFGDVLTGEFREIEVEL
ncbi:MAG: hypothetical protein IJG40_15400 [Oscillospiraceae bacterium]|nr:hypothetical protein [Oscillospiraceae bacterium]